MEEGGRRTGGRGREDGRGRTGEGGRGREDGRGRMGEGGRGREDGRGRTEEGGRKREDGRGIMDNKREGGGDGGVCREIQAYTSEMGGGGGRMHAASLPVPASS